jgi:hypothetical protein
MTKKEILKLLRPQWFAKNYKLKIHRVEEHADFNMTLVFYTVKNLNSPSGVGSPLKQWRIKAIPIEKGAASAGSWDMVTRTKTT